MKRAFTCLALAAAAFSAFGQADLLGTWKAKAQLDSAKVPKAQNPQQQKQLDAAIVAVKKLSVVLTLKKGGLYVVKVANAPGPQPNQEEEGKWSFAKNTVTTIATKQNGKPPRAGEKPQNLNYDKAKKHLTMAQGPLIFVFSK